jgi:PAS domain S-box-containing protein
VKEKEGRRTEQSGVSRELREVHVLLEKSAARYARLYEGAPVGLCTVDSVGRIREINAAASATLGGPRELLLGKLFAVEARLTETAKFLTHVRRCTASRRRVTSEFVVAPRVTGGPRVLQLVSDPIRDAHGETVCLTAIIDVSDVKAMDARIRMLAAGVRLSESLDSAAVIEAAVELMVPQLADICFIDLVSPSGAIERVGIRFADSKKQLALGERMKRAAPQPGWRTPQAHVIASGEPMFLAEMPDTQPDMRSRRHDYAALMERAGIQALMIVPIAAHGRVLGALTLASAESARRYSKIDLGLTSDVAARLALALENARLYEETERMNRLLLGGAKASGIVAISSDAIISIDPAQRITLWNDGAEKIYGYSRKEALGAPFDMLIPERLRARVLAQFAEFVGGSESARELSTPSEELVGLRKNGVEFPADVAISKLEVADERILTVSIRDITDRKRIEREQRALARLGQVLASTLNYESTLTQLMQLIAEDLGDFAILYVIDGDRAPHRVRAASRFPAEEWYTELVLATRADAAPEHPVARAIATKQPLVLEATPAVLVSLAHSEEHARALALIKLRSIMTVPLIIRERCLGALLFKSSSRVYDAADLRLAEEIARRTALLIENARLHHTARQAIRARDDVLGIVAHDLRNPLSTIVLEASVLAMTKTGGQDTAVREAGDAIQHAANLMKRLIQDLLDASRVDSGGLSIEAARVPVAALIAELARGQQAIAASASLELLVDVRPDVGDVFGDRDRLIQVIENLMNNAERFTPKGGRITIGARRREGDVLLWVSDTGAGIDARVLPFVFDRFSPKRKIDRRGTGLGLPIVKGIVEAHRGRVWAESKIGEGSTFFFTIPSAPSEEVPRRRARDGAQGRKKQNERADARR